MLTKSPPLQWNIKLPLRRSNANSSGIKQTVKAPAWISTKHMGICSCLLHMEGPPIALVSAVAVYIVLMHPIIWVFRCKPPILFRKLFVSLGFDLGLIWLVFLGLVHGFLGFLFCVIIIDVNILAV